jgi:hypothetical protein
MGENLLAGGIVHREPSFTRVTIRHYGCRWVMQPDTESGKVWEPWLTMPNGRSVQFFVRLYESIHEHGDLGAEFVGGTLVFVDLDR